MVKKKETKTDNLFKDKIEFNREELKDPAMLICKKKKYKDQNGNQVVNASTVWDALDETINLMESLVYDKVNAFLKENMTEVYQRLRGLEEENKTLKLGQDKFKQTLSELKNLYATELDKVVSNFKAGMDTTEKEALGVVGMEKKAGGQQNGQGQQQGNEVPDREF